MRKCVPASSFRASIGPISGACGLMLLVLSTATAQDTIQQLTGALRGTDEAARIQAIDKLGRMGAAAKGAVADLIKQLEDPSPTVRAHAAHSLQLIGPAASEAAAALAKATEDKDMHVQRIAVAALEAVHPDPAVAAPAYAKALEDDDSAVQVEALSALTELGEAAVPVLGKATKNPETRYWAVLALGELGPQAKGAVEDLARVMEDKREELRREALISLARIGPDAAAAVPTITQALADPDSGVRNAAAFALGRIGPAAASASGVLAQAMKSQDELHRAVSTWALARIDPKDKVIREQAIALLLDVLEKPNPRVQAAALRGLLDLEPGPAQVVPVLAKIFAKADPTIVHEIMSAMPGYGDAATPVLIEALKRPEVRWPAAMMIAQIGPKASATVPALTAALTDKNPDVRSEVLFALASMDGAAAAAQGAIITLLDDPEVRVRASAAYTLGRLGPSASSAIPQLRKAMESSDSLLRVAGAWGLVHVAPKDPKVASDTVPVLMQGLQHENVQVRRGAAGALGQLGPAARVAVPQLQTATHDSDETVRKAALEALERVGGTIVEPRSRKAVPRK